MERRRYENGDKIMGELLKLKESIQKKLEYYNSIDLNILISSVDKTRRVKHTIEVLQEVLTEIDNLLNEEEK